MIKNKAITPPKISVIMAVFNTEKFVGEAIESILNQTFNDFELIIIDDASTDNSLSIIRKYEKQDERIKVIVNEVNLGISKSRNKGVAVVRGEFIANVDSDDINLKDRFEKQINYFLDFPETLVLGGRHKLIDSEGNEKPYTWSFPGKVYRWDTLTTKVAVMHPCMMTRTNYIREIGGYPEGLENAIDRALFIEMALAPKFSMNNLSDFLIKYRIHSNSTSNKEAILQTENSRKVRKQAVEDVLGRNLPDDEFTAVFEKEPGFVSADLSRRAYLMYIEFYKKFINRFHPSKEERLYARNIVVKRTFSEIRKHPSKNLVTFGRLFLIDPLFFIRRFLLNFRLLQQNHGGSEIKDGQ